VRSLWLTGQVRTSFLRKEAEIITETQQRNEKSQRSHVKARKRRLRELGCQGWIEMSAGLGELKCPPLRQGSSAGGR
jgi:hypothetical protein